MNQIKKREGDIPVAVYLCRHGETQYNALGLFQGQGIDLPLNSNGQEQAKELARLFSRGGLPLMDIGFTSPLKRARETANIVWENLTPEQRFPLVVHPLIKEGAFGWAEGQAKENVKTQMPDTYAAWRQHHDLETRFPGGESKGEIANRGIQFLDHVLNRYQKAYATSPQDEVRIAVFSHAAFLRCLLYKMGVVLDEIPNAKPLKITYHPGKGWRYDGVVVASQSKDTVKQGQQEKIR